MSGSAIKFVLKIPAYKAQITVVAGDHCDAGKLIPAWTGCVQGDGYMARTVFRVAGGKYPFQVFIHTRTIAISVIAHEAVHAASFIFDAMGCEADFNNDEYTAYLVQHICEEAENKFNVYK